MEISRNVWHVGCLGQHLLDQCCILGREGFALRFALFHLRKFYHGRQYEQPLSLALVRQNASNSLALGPDPRVAALNHPGLEGDLVRRAAAERPVYDSGMA
jgi:hypothetical protein